MTSQPRALRLVVVLALVLAYAIAAAPVSAHPDGDNVNGTVTAISGSTLTVLDKAGTSHTVVVTGTTVYKLPHHLTGSLADITVGTKIKAEGTLSGGILTAAVVKIRLDHVNGTVTAIPSGTSLTVLGKNGTTYTVNVTGTTLYKLPHRLTGTFGDIAVGSKVKAEGTLVGTTLTARIVEIKWDHVNGTVTAISGSTLTVMGKNSTSYTVTVTGATVYDRPGHVPGTFADIAVGSKIKAEGTLVGTTLTARFISIKH